MGKALKIAAISTVISKLVFLKVNILFAYKNPRPAQGINWVLTRLTASPLADFRDQFKGLLSVVLTPTSQCRTIISSRRDTATPVGSSGTAQLAKYALLASGRRHLSEAFLNYIGILAKSKRS
jgi:hypothetical protein